jgi:methylated-DNA-[protein]-cysteine S-methyltransferase
MEITLIDNQDQASTAAFASELKTKYGFLRIVGNQHAITEIRFFEQSLADDNIDHKPNSITELGKKQLSEYIAGSRKHFELALAPKGTMFQKQVWQQLLNIDFGETASYLDIANAINKPKACRAVGAANGKNPISIVIPCHRIIGSSGKLTGYAGGLERKAYLLDLEKTT